MEFLSGWFYSVGGWESLLPAELERASPTTPLFPSPASSPEGLVLSPSDFSSWVSLCHLPGNLEALRPCVMYLVLVRIVEIVSIQLYSPAIYTLCYDV